MNTLSTEGSKSNILNGNFLKHLKKKKVHCVSSII